MQNPEPDDLDALSAKLEAAKPPEPAAPSGRAAMSGDAMRLALDLVIAVAIGLGAGLWLDKTLGTKPWLMLIFMIFGVAAGFRNFYVFAGKLLRPDPQDPK